MQSIVLHRKHFSRDNMLATLLYFLFLFTNIQSCNESFDIPELLSKTVYYPESLLYDCEKRSHAAVLDELKQKPHFLAARFGKLEILKEIVTKNSIDVVAETFSDGSNLLHFATLDNHFDTIKWLIEQKVDINQANIKGHVPLFFLFTTKNRTLESLKFFLEHGVDSQKKLELYWLRSGKRTDSFDLITVFLNTQPLHWAAHYGWAEAIDIFKQDIASINSEQSAYHPLALAVEAAQCDAIYQLLKYGALIDEFGCLKFGRQLSYAPFILTGAKEGSQKYYQTLKAFKILILFGGKCEPEFIHPLVLARPDVFFAENKNSTIIIKDLKDINQTDELGIPALHYACGQGNLHLMVQLRKAGTNIFYKDIYGSRIIDIVNFILQRNQFTDQKEKLKYEELKKYLYFFYRFKNSVLAMFDLHASQRKSLLKLQYNENYKPIVLPHDIVKHINYFIEH